MEGRSRLTVAGLDVGRRSDRTALVTLDPPGSVRLVRLLSGVPLPEQARRLAPVLLPCELVCVDATGLGLGLAEGLAEAGVRVVAVTITGARNPARNPETPSRNPGSGVSRSFQEFSGTPKLETSANFFIDNRLRAATAPKAWLVQRVAAALAARALSCPPIVPGAETMLAELRAMVPKWKPSGTVRYEARRGHDDTVTALALALLAGDIVRGTVAQEPPR